MSSRRRGDRRVVPGIHPVRELLRSGTAVRNIAFDRERDPAGALGAVLDEARAAGFAVRSVGGDELDRLTGGVEHQGVAAVADPYPYRNLDGLLAGVPESEPALLVAIDGVTDPRNLGSIARTAEAIGAHGLVGTSRRSVGVTPAAEKAAAGALAHLPVAEVTNLVRALRSLGEEGVWSVGLDADGPVSLHDCDLFTEPVVLVVGAEGRGLARLTAETCDLLVALSLRGRIASLNAAVAAGVALYEVVRRRDG